MIDLGSPAVMEPVIEHLLHRIHRQQAQTGQRVWMWLYVHGLEEGCSFEEAIGTDPVEPEELLQTELWEHDTEVDDDDAAVGEYELAGVGDGYDLASACPWDQRPSLHFQGWTLTPTGDYEWDCQGEGFAAGDDEDAAHIFIVRVYRHILRQTMARAPEAIAGFVLELHDSALPREWIAADNQSSE